MARDRLTPRIVAAGQAAYYLTTGIAPFVSRRAFEAVTGRKRDWWLVLAVGWLVAVDGVALAGAAARGTVTPELRPLGAGGAGALAGVDIVYAVRGRIPPTYLLDGAIQLGIVAAWMAARPATRVGGLRQVGDRRSGLGRA